jgi:hypothetical protein
MRMALLSSLPGAPGFFIDAGEFLKNNPMQSTFRRQSVQRAVVPYP